MSIPDQISAMLSCNSAVKLQAIFYEPGSSHAASASSLQAATRALHGDVPSYPFVAPRLAEAVRKAEQAWVQMSAQLEAVMPRHDLSKVFLGR